MGSPPVEPGNDGGADAPPLAGRTFASVETHGRSLVAGSAVRLTFGVDGLAAQAGCNTLFGSATWTNGTLVAPVLASTMMACSPELMTQDTWLAELLRSSPALALEGRRLTIGDSTSGLVLVETEA
ncbi:META domain-containing protein [Actinotalea sp. K2]|uniref:META domain-containing protein n=1 Tax=Actinotalea sp. K2 TaxID=2939438 RepID=UPI00201809FB|nr:META domain-containing protein [Actinotalea sp. K2]MCL3861906.1 META domain-containing protein [Actinotalea sp. K2]